MEPNAIGCPSGPAPEDQPQHLPANSSKINSLLHQYPIIHPIMAGIVSSLATLTG